MGGGGGGGRWRGEGCYRLESVHVLILHEMMFLILHKRVMWFCFVCLFVCLYVFASSPGHPSVTADEASYWQHVFCAVGDSV